jgi:hypothetical protein
VAGTTKQRLRQLLFIAASTVCATGCDPYPGKLRDHWDLSNNRFQIRVEVHDEGNKAHFFEAGCHVKLASAPVGSNEWVPFGNAYFSRCDQNLKDRVRFVNHQTAYVFMQWWYSVTTDAGQSWSTWDVPAHLPGKAYYNPKLIETVAISPSGAGTMTLNPEGVPGKERLILYTEDFGRLWKTQ